MPLNKLIDKITRLQLDEDILLEKGCSKVDITKPLVLDNILFRKSKRSINYGTTPSGLPFEINIVHTALNCYAYKHSFATLGVLLIELVCSNQAYIEINITHPQSEIKQLFFYLEKENESTILRREHAETFDAFDYTVQEVHKFPFSNFRSNPRTIDEDQMPSFFLSCSDRKYLDTEEQTQKSDQLITSLTVKSITQLAALFLDIGNAQNEDDEVCLENPLYGFGGTGKQSIEMRFTLPGSFLWFEKEDINALCF
jgi:hypothetical protein